MQKLDNPPKNFLEFTPKCIIVGVEGGGPEIFLGVQSYSFGNSGPHAKIQSPRTTPSGRKVRVQKVNGFLNKKIIHVIKLCTEV